MENRLLLESEVIKTVDKHTNDENQLDNDISCILEEVNPVVLVGSKEALDNLKVETKPVQKQKRIELFENEDVVLEQRGNRYYLSLYDKEGKFQREVTIDVKDDYKVGLGNCKQRRLCMKTFMIILFAIATVIWLLWLIGFPIYKKCIKKEPLWSSCYTLVLCCMALVINLINLCLKLIK